MKKGLIYTIFISAVFIGCSGGGSSSPTNSSSQSSISSVSVSSSSVATTSIDMELNKSYVISKGQTITPLSEDAFIEVEKVAGSDTTVKLTQGLAKIE